MGAEIAALIAPFVKWGGIVGGALLALWLCTKSIKRSGEKKRELEILTNAKRKETKAREGYRGDLDQRIDRWRRRRRLRDE